MGQKYRSIRWYGEPCPRDPLVAMPRNLPRAGGTKARERHILRIVRSRGNFLMRPCAEIARIGSFLFDESVRRYRIA
jgi:hypothetical protein